MTCLAFKLDLVVHARVFILLIKNLKTCFKFCLGPYMGWLIGITSEMFKRFEDLLVKNDKTDKYYLKMDNDLSKAKILKLGFTRFNISFFFEETTVDFILNAIKFVCEHGWKFLTVYKFIMETGSYRHQNNKKLYNSLYDITYNSNNFNFKSNETLKNEIKCPASFDVR